MDLYPVPTYVEDPLVLENRFRGAPARPVALPSFEDARPRLPQPFWENHAQTIACYWAAWRLAFSNLKNPFPDSGFVSPFIDTAFNGCLFMWDSSFILFFGRYGRRAFDFQGTLDNFYARQHPDGFICREIDYATGLDRFHRFDPVSTGPNVMPWVEWQHYLDTGDAGRLARIFPGLVAYHRWLRAYRTWPDGSYWATGFSCGMDNQPRVDPPLHAWFSHAHQTWVDACLQQVLSARTLLDLGRVLGREAELCDLRLEAEHLTSYINTHLWNEDTGFYHDRRADGRLTPVKSIGAYWALLADVAAPERAARLAAHLGDPALFHRPHRVPTLSADHPAYAPGGDYWRGGVWAPTNYLVLRGLERTGEERLAHEIALNHLMQVVQVFGDTGTLWENYAPEAPTPGQTAMRDFVGWTGLPPIAVLFEQVFGLRADAPRRRLVWDLRLTDAHGVTNYPFGAAGLLDLRCEARADPRERPRVRVSSSVPVEIDLRWEGGREVRTLDAGIPWTVA